MNPLLADRKLLEELWRGRLKDAKLRLEFARSYLREVVEECPLREISGTDSHSAYQKAIRAEAYALREYARVMRIYHDFSVNGVIPDESEWLKRRAAGSDGSDEAERIAG